MGNPLVRGHPEDAKDFLCVPLRTLSALCVRFDLKTTSGRGYAAPALRTNVAFNLISVPARACDTGQFFFAVSACSRKVSASMPGTSPSVLSSIVVILKPSPTFSRLTFALVLMRVGLNPPFVNPAARAIEKHPACAAPINSSGFVPVPSSNLEAKEYWNSPLPLGEGSGVRARSVAPLPKLILPLPSLSVPSQTALAVRFAMRVISLDDLVVS